MLSDATFVDEHLRQTRGDRLFEVLLKDGSPAFVYVLLEHKSTPDIRTPLQMLGYMVRIWERYVAGQPDKRLTLPAIIPLIVYHGQAPWSVPTSVIDCLAGDEQWVEHFRHFRYIIRDIGRVDDARLSSRPHIRSVLMALKYGSRENASLEIIIDLLSGLPGDSVLLMQVARYILSVMKPLTIEDWISVVSAARPEEKDSMVSIAAQTWLTEGRNSGLKEGRAEGEAAGLRESIIDLLEMRFGPLDPSVSTKLSGLAADQLRPLVRRAAVASSPQAVLEGLPDA